MTFQQTFFLCLELGKLIKNHKIGKIKPNNLLPTFYKVSLKTTSLQSNITFIWAIFKQHKYQFLQSLATKPVHTSSTYIS